MLGEDHSLTLEFPKHKDKIDQLNSHDSGFAQKAQRYHDLDAQIRNLELDNAPIGDDDLHKLKQERAKLKDNLYQRIISA